MPGKTTHTVENLRSNLRMLGVKKDYDLIVHVSLKSLGKVVDGYRSFLEALLLVIGSEGTILAPAFYYYNIDPAEHRVPPPPEELETYRARCRPFNLHLSQSMEGAFGEMVRLHKNGFRSAHPIISFAAIGKRAREYTENVAIDNADGLDSPIGRAYSRGKTQILLVGVDHMKNTSIHLAESLAGCPHYIEKTTRYKLDDQTWGVIKSIGHCSAGFHKVRGIIDFPKYEISGKVGDSLTYLVEQKPFVDSVRDALIKTPWALLCDNPYCNECAKSRDLYGLEQLKEREYHIRKPYLE